MGLHSKQATALLPHQAQIYVQGCKLVSIAGPDRGLSHNLGSGETTVGSDPKCDIHISDPTVSRRHFAIVGDEQSFLLRDLDSTNGTYLDDLRVKEVYLRPGVVIRAGEVLLRFEVDYEPVEASPRPEFDRLLGRSQCMQQIFGALEKVANSDATVLIQGETGTGKGAVARAIHASSRRADGPFVVFDCAGTAPTLMESELFGHERGAFTGAVSQRIGALEAASGGTLFIDELTELSLSLQPKLLRALEEREFIRVGATTPIATDCRVIAASQADLWNEVMAERFRQDLYFRVAVVSIPLPPLRERREDIPLLVSRFLSEFDHAGYSTIEDLDDDFRKRTQNYEWPGNVRELRNFVERACVMEELALEAGPTATPPSSTNASSKDGQLHLSVSFPETIPYQEAKELVLDTLEREYLTRLLDRAEGNVAKAARNAQIGRRHLYTLLAKHRLGSYSDD